MELLKYGQLGVTVSESEEEMAELAAADFARLARSELEKRQGIAVILSTGNSQLGFFRALRLQEIEWSRITVLVADEYVGLAPSDPRSLHSVMQKNLIEHVRPRAFLGFHGDCEPIEDELTRYGDVVREHEPVICVLGIGENGHLGFNDPPADLSTDEGVRIQELDEGCRNQQVGEGHFPSLEAVPRFGLTQSVPALLAPKALLVVVPDERKARAVRDALEGPVTPACPASILQSQAHAHLYLDRNSAALLQR